MIEKLDAVKMQESPLFKDSFNSVSKVSFGRLDNLKDQVANSVWRETPIVVNTRKPHILDSIFEKAINPA